MKRTKALAVGIFACLFSGAVLAVDDVPDHSTSTPYNAQGLQASLPDTVVSPQGGANVVNGFDGRYLHKTNMACGLPPLPPLGCRVGACVCDQNGRNCQWTFICN